MSCVIVNFNAEAGIVTAGARQALNCYLGGYNMIIKVKITVLIPAIRLASTGRARIIWVIAAIRPECPDPSNSISKRRNCDLLDVSEGCVIDGGERVVGTEVHGHLVVRGGSKGGEACGSRSLSLSVRSSIHTLSSERHFGRYWWGIDKMVSFGVVSKNVFYMVTPLIGKGFAKWLTGKKRVNNVKGICFATYM